MPVLSRAVSIVDREGDGCVFVFASAASAIVAAALG